MPVNKIFKKFNLSASSKKAVNFGTLLKTNLNDYAFSVVWTTGKICNLSYLAANASPSTIWHPIITKPITDNDGEISVKLGSLSVGMAVRINFGIQAVEAIPKIAVLITNITTGTVTKFPAGNTYKTLAKGDLWQDTISVNLP